MLLRVEYDSVRIEQLPLAFSEGFSPRPKVSFGLALSVGYESNAEYLDVELTEPVDVEALPDAPSRSRPSTTMPPPTPVDTTMAM